MKIVKYLKNDIPASLVVFLVAMPLCLGVGFASTNVVGVEGTPNVFAGIIAGIVGGTIVGLLSGSRIGVSGPAAGLITILTGAIMTLGSYEAFLTAVVLSGVLQIIMGYVRLGVIGYYFPSSVIKGMLASIGIILILKEIPHAFGYDKDFIGDESLLQPDGHNTFSELYYMLNYVNMGAIVISVVSILILILFNRPFMKRIAIFKIIPGALIVVVLGVVLNAFFKISIPDFYISGEHLVVLPVAESFGEFTSFFTNPDFSSLKNPNVYVIAGTIALIGSLETLLSVEATDNLDPEKHKTPTNRELKAQGVGNIVSGLIGGLPVTQVIVRSSANVSAGAKTKTSTILHGIFLLISVAFIPTIINLIPLASLAAILIMVGYKLARIELIRKMYRSGWEQFIPFIATIIGVLVTNLLAGIGIGVAVAIFFILRRNYRHNYVIKKDKQGEQEVINMKLSEEVTFLNKASIVDFFCNTPENVKIIIDGTNCKSINYDVLESIVEFRDFGAPEKNIELELIDITGLESFELA